MSTPRNDYLANGLFAKLTGQFADKPTRARHDALTSVVAPGVTPTRGHRSPTGGLR